MGFALGLHGLKPGFAWFQTQDKPAKNRVYFLTTPYQASGVRRQESGIRNQETEKLPAAKPPSVQAAS
jgi:hypothetical protein